MRRSLHWFVLLNAIFLGCRGCTTLPPHIVFIFPDDLGWNDVSFHGSRQIPTPNLDALAADGIVLNSYYTSSVCTPSRSALMSGRYASSIGMQRGIEGAEPRGLPLHLTLLPQHLKRLGYKTHAIGKWHMGFYHKEYTPIYRGFDTHYGYWNAANDYFNYIYSDDLANNTWGRDIRRNMEVDLEVYGNYSTTAYTREAIDIIRNHDTTKPLFLYFAEQAPHHGAITDPLRAPSDYIDRFQNIRETNRRIYAGMVSALDDSIGQVFTALHEKDMLRKTIFVFASDNGGGDPGLWCGSGSNWPLRGTKGTYWEGGIRVPTLVWSPLFRQSGKVVNALFHVTDWLPTLYRAAGGRIEDLGQIDGVDQWNVLVAGENTTRRSILIEIDDVWNNGAIRVDNYKLIYGLQNEGNWDGWYGPSGRTVEPNSFDYDRVSTIRPILRHMNRRTVPFDYYFSNAETEVQCSPPPTDPHANCDPVEAPCLFDVVQDPCEYINLAKSHPSVYRDMLDKLNEFKKMAVPPEIADRDPAGDPKFFNYIWTNWADPDPSF